MTGGYVEVDSVSKFYSTKRVVTHALDEVSFDIPEGGFTSVLGPSGCGKSTLLMLVAGLIEKSGGSIRIAGEEVTKPQTGLGIVFQQDVLLEWRSVIENVLLSVETPRISRRERQDARDRAHELLASVHLTGFEDSLPHELSGGMRQRVALCRGLLRNPSLLLMDEPFGELDAITRDQLSLDLQRLWNTHRNTVLFITHSISEAIFLSDRVIVMTPRPGRIDEIIEIDLPRPRRLRARESVEFSDYADIIRELFLARGVLREEEG